MPVGRGQHQAQQTEKPYKLVYRNNDADQKLMAERNADVQEDRRMLFRIGINLDDVLEAALQAATRALNFLQQNLPLGDMAAVGSMLSDPPRRTCMRRREFITLLGGTVLAWPLDARAQQPDQKRQIGVLMNIAVSDPEGQSRVAAFRQGLQELGWNEGRNVRIDYRWDANDAVRSRGYAVELIAFAPDVILAAASPVVAALQEATRTLPIVFATVIAPVGAGFVESLARPGGNTTGFTLFEYSMSGKWLELLKEIAPRVKRVAVLRDPGIAADAGQLGAIQAMAPSFGVELSPVGVRDAGEIERPRRRGDRMSGSPHVRIGASVSRCPCYVRLARNLGNASSV